MAESKCSVCAPFVAGAVAVVSVINMVVTLGSYNLPKPSKLRNFLQHFNDNINFLITFKLKIAIKLHRKSLYIFSVCYVSSFIPALPKCVR